MSMKRRLNRLENQKSEQAAPRIPLNLDLLPPDTRADFLVYWSEQRGIDAKRMKTKTLHALLEQCDAFTEQPSG